MKKSVTSLELRKLIVKLCHHHHHIALVARISLTLSRHSSLSFIALGRSSGQHPVSSHSCWMYVRAGRPAFAWPCVGIHKSTSLMSSSLLLQQCPACLIKINSWLGIHSILRKLGHVKPRNHLVGLGKLLQGKTDGLVMNQKKDQFATATAICKRANADFGIKISRYTISQGLNEINLNSQVASTKPYISKKNKMSRLKFATEHIWTEEHWDCVHFSDESKFNLFGHYRRRFLQHSPKEWY